MLRTRISTGVLVSGGVALALLLAGCNEGPDAANPAVPTISGTAPPVTSAPPATATTTPTTTPPPTTTTQADEPAPPPRPGVNTGECKVADLKLSIGGGDSATGTTYRALVFTNKSDRTCTLHGYPGVSYVAGDDGHQVGPAAFRTGTKGPPVTLQPGASAYADVGFVQVRNYDPADCQPTEVRGLRVYPPHEYDSMYVPHPGLGCAKTPPGNQLTVSTVRPGTGLPH